MGQVLGQDSIGTLSHSLGVISLTASALTIGGQQYRTDTLNYTLTGLLANTKYNLFAVLSLGVVVLVPSTNSITVGPAGYTSWKFVRSFTTNASSNFGAFAGAVSDPNPVGTFVQSLLTLSQFQSLYGTNWVLADGSSVAGSMYASVTGNSTVPDARGLALRGKNNGRADGNQDPDGERALGSFQGDSFGSHTHIQNAHSHTSGVYTVGAGGANGPETFGDTNQPQINTGSTTATNQNTGGNETRMKNIAVNIFIKINQD